MISLHDYSKSKDDEKESLPTLLNDLNKMLDEPFEILCLKPKEITIFQVFIIMSILNEILKSLSNLLFLYVYILNINFHFKIGSKQEDE